MKSLVLTVLAYAVATLAQPMFATGGLGEIGKKFGSKVGGNIGGGVGEAFETGLSVPGLIRPPSGMPMGPSRPIGPRNPTGPSRPLGRPRYDNGYSSGGNYGGREYEGGSSGGSRRGYEKQGSGREYDKGESYKREKTVNEREQGVRYEGGREGQGSSRGGSRDRYDNYGRDKSKYGEGYNSGYGRDSYV